MLIRLLSWLIGVPLAGIAVLFALSNRAEVPVSFWPFLDGLQLPLYLVALLPLALGLLLGAAGPLAALLATRMALRTHKQKLAALSRTQAGSAAVAADQGLTSP